MREFSRFANHECAKLAMSSLAGFELCGRPLKVGPVIDGSTGNTAVKSNTNIEATSSNDWKLDDDDGASGMQMNAQSRVALMHKLGQAAGIQMPTPLAPPPSSSASIANSQSLGTPSQYIIISNMFALEEETDIDWHLDLNEDVTEECSKYGKVVRCDVETKKSGGFVYIKFEQTESAVNAMKALNNRYFAGRIITVSYIDAIKYSSLIS